ncbi:MAG: NlpC/P60 family protein, partial [Collinsella sp.]|nr:NlpC/P60 family protein [Collinsella sp.]
KASGWDQAPTNVAFAVKAPSGAVTWLQAYRQTDGSWSATASAASAFKAWGTYRATAYATFSGSTIQVGADSVQVDAGSIKVSASVSSAGDITATASGWKISPSNVAFEVRMASGTVKWFQAARQADGSWKMGISAARDLREWGSYRVTAYATIAGWTSSYGSASTSFDVGDVRTSAVVSGGGSFDLWLAGFKVTPSNAAFEVLLPQGGSKWIQAVRQGNGSWKATGYASQGFSVYGTYRVRAYVTIQGLTLPLASTSFTFPPYVGYQNPSWMYQVSNQSARIKNQGLNQFGYASPSRIPYNATRNDLVNAVITRAMDYMGTPYRWDYSTAPGGGVDCSGLVMQALYAVGMDLTPYNPWDHYYTPGHDQYANHMWSNPRFKHVSFGERQPGDLICYAGHISIYLGNDRVIEAYPPRVMISSIYARPQMRGVIRAIA